MSSMEEQFDAAQEAGNVEDGNVQIFAFKAPGEYIVGIVKEIDDFTEGGFEANCKKYTIRTDHGLFTLVLGEATDKQFLAKDPLGKLVKIEYNGKKDLDDGRKVNLFATYIAKKA